MGCMNSIHKQQHKKDNKEGDRNREKMHKDQHSSMLKKTQYFY